ncbi:pilus assembly protein TadG-related protein [Aeromicrobium sp. UC242_57]|uniref:pilus assembly protein TadG-related protein n=1 Tax=Aeromicrobium sp. UC242_57 TaxID=3374624 RepID=UPI0037B99153
MTSTAASREEGQITVMTVGFLVVIGLLVVVVVNSSAAFLERRKLDNLADGAAIAAADGLSRDTFYEKGDIVLDRSQARRLVRQYVTTPGTRVARVSISDDEVTVRLERRIDLAIRPPGWSSRTRIVAEATARLTLGE